MKNSTRWAVGAATATAVVGGTLIAPAVANADPDLAPTTAEELLTGLAAAQQRGFSGTVVQTTDLGLPELPQPTGTAGELSTLLAGSTTLRLWSDGADRSRVAVLGALAETDVVRDGADAWVWRSDERTAVHAVIPDSTEGADSTGGTDGAGAPALGAAGAAGAGTPGEAVESALAAIDPTTEVTLDGTTTVAGRDAYELVLAPRDTASLIGEVRVAVDAETSYPLRAQVFARGAADPAFETGFTSISFAVPGDEVFAFTPPAGTTVTEADTSAMAGGGDQDGAGQDDGQEPTVIGEGWTSVVVARDAAGALDAVSGAGAGGQGGGQGGDTSGITDALVGAFQPVQGDFGTGRVFSSSLVSVLALDDGRVLMGAVAPEALQRAAADPIAAP